MHRIAVVGGGFGGLYAARHLPSKDVQVTLVDRRNFHLFQPLLYQVATGGLSPGDIASPLRAVFKKQRHIQVLQAEVVDFDPAARELVLADGVLPYDTLIVAAGSRVHHFGHEEWPQHAPGLKRIEDALEMRRRILSAFERAERAGQQERGALLRFVVIGGGPTGVELAGALAELAYNTLRNEFRHYDTRDVEVLLLEGGSRLLPTFPEELSQRAEESLRHLGVRVQVGARVKAVAEGEVLYECAEETIAVATATVLWGAGMSASPLAGIMAQRTGAELDSGGRIKIEPDLSIKGYPEILLLGDMAHCVGADNQPLPGVAPVAMQQGRYVARLVAARLKGKELGPFKYVNKGNLAVIGRHAAVADLGFLRLAGYPAWLIWLFVHIAYLIEFDNKVIVLFQWAWNYFTRKRGARLITDEKK